jgi:hypothetical protein
MEDMEVLKAILRCSREYWEMGRMLGLVALIRVNTREIKVDFQGAREGLEAREGTEAIGAKEA